MIVNGPVVPRNPISQAAVALPHRFLGSVGLLSAASEKRHGGPLELVAANWKAGGYVVDFVTIPTNTVTTFSNGWTYYLRGNYYTGSALTFQSGTTLKFTNGVNLLAYGSLTFPASQPYAVFTSMDDDLFGEKILSAAGGGNSDGNPSDRRASEALWVYYPSNSTTVRNVRFRWAQKCLRVDDDSGPGHTFQNSVLEHSSIGVDALNAAVAPVSVSNVRQCNVTTPYQGYVSGTITNDAGIVNACNRTNTQAEPATAVRSCPGSEPNNTKVVIVSLSLLQSSNGLVRMISNDGGKTWPVVGLIATNGAAIPAADGDGDPSLFYDSFTNLFLAYRTTSAGAALVMSTDDGTNWVQVPGFNGTNLGGSIVRLATGPSGKAGIPEALWISMKTNDPSRLLVCTGTEIRGAGTNNVGGSGKWTTNLFMPGPSGCKFHSVAVGPTGQVAVVYSRGGGPELELGPTSYYTVTDPDGLGTNVFSHQTSATFSNNLGADEILAHGFLTPMPVLSWYLGTGAGTLYLTYTGMTNSTPGSDDTDVFVRKSTDGGQTWSSEIKVHTTSTRSQFHPWIAVDSQSANVAVVWYDCRDDASNAKPHLYGAVSRDGFASAPSIFRITPQAAVPDGTSGDLKEYIGITYFKGNLYPAWLNHRSLTDLKWDVFACRIPY